MKELTSNMSVEEVRSVITKCLKDAALVNYTRISEFAKIEGMMVCLFRVVLWPH